MTALTQITSRVQMFLEARSKATQGKWQQGGCSGRVILYPGAKDAWSGGDIADIDTKANSDFILLAANEGPAIARALLKACEALESIRLEIDRGKTKDCLGCCNGNDIPEEELCRSCSRIWIHGKCYFMWDWEVTEKRVETLTEIAEMLKERE